MKQQTFTILKGIIFFVFFSFVISDESFLYNVNDNENLVSGIPLLKFQERCFENPDLIPCLYWNWIREKANYEDKIQLADAFKSAENTEKTENGTLSPPGAPEENGKEEILIGIPFANLERPLEKRFTVFRRRNPGAQGFKRGPGFRSWGGKRDLIYAGQDLDKKSKFTSWGGKRDSSYADSGGEAEEKRTKFVNWGGKRDELKNTDEFATKRSKFLSWGGKKRTADPEENKTKILKNSKEAFNWYDQEEKRGSSWNYRGLFFREPFKKHVPKRPQFQSWGGKRTLPLWNDHFGFYGVRYPRFQFSKFFDGGEKRKFSSWGGKRYKNEGHTDKSSDVITDPWGEQIVRDFKSSHIFENRGGKRSTFEEGKENKSNEFIKDIFDFKPRQTENEKPLAREKREKLFKIEIKNLPHESRIDFKSSGGEREGENTTR